ncbi:hypothetical protein DV738_g2584, partial [Chaetothyriales sp. CBS 135597]
MIIGNSVGYTAMSAISLVTKAAATAMVPFTAVFLYPGLKDPQIFSYTTKNSATPLIAFPRPATRLASQAGEGHLV